jgi:hypothetical protein
MFKPKEPKSAKIFPSVDSSFFASLSWFYHDPFVRRSPVHHSGPSLSFFVSSELNFLSAQLTRSAASDSTQRRFEIDDREIYRSKQLGLPLREGKAAPTIGQHSRWSTHPAQRVA